MAEYHRNHSAEGQTIKKVSSMQNFDQAQQAPRSRLSAGSQANISSQDIKLSARSSFNQGMPFLQEIEQSQQKQQAKIFQSLEQSETLFRDASQENELFSALRSYRIDQYKFKASCLKSKCTIHENENIQIGLISNFEERGGQRFVFQCSLHLINKSPSKYKSLALRAIQDQEGTPRLFVSPPLCLSASLSLCLC